MFGRFSEPRSADIIPGQPPYLSRVSVNLYSLHRISVFISSYYLLNTRPYRILHKRT